MKKLYSIALLSVLIIGLAAFGAFAVEGWVDYDFYGAGSFAQQWNSEGEVFTSMSANAWGSSIADGRFYGEDWGNEDPPNQYASNGLDVVMSRIDADLTGQGSLDYYFERLDGGVYPGGMNASSHTRVEIYAAPVATMTPTAELNTESHTTGNPYIGTPPLSELISDYNEDSGESGWSPLRAAGPAGGLITTASGYDVEVDTQAFYTPNPDCDPCVSVPNQGYFFSKEITNTEGERLFIRSQGGGWAGMLSQDSDAGDDELLLGWENVNSRDPMSNGGGGAEFDATGWGSVEVGGSMGDLQFNTLGTINNQVPGTEGYIGFGWSGGSSFGLNDFTVHKDY